MPTPERMSYELALLKWAEDALVDFAPGGGAKFVVFAPFEGPLLPEPLVTLQVARTEPMGTPSTQMLGASEANDADGHPLYPLRITTWQTGTVSINVLGPKHAAMIQALMVSRWNPIIAGANHERGISIGAPSAFIDGDSIQGAVWRRRSRVDFEFTFTTQDTVHLRDVKGVTIKRSDEG